VATVVLISSFICTCWVFGVLCEGRGDDQKALTRLIEVAAIPAVSFADGESAADTERRSKALDELEKAEKGDAKLPFLHFNFGFAYLHLGDTNARRRNFARTLRRRRICRTATSNSGNSI